MKDTQTEVVFRKWIKDGDIIALFPNHAWAQGFSVLVTSYEHIGQHGGAHYQNVLKETVPATPKDYADLKAELEGLGYNLKVRQRGQRRA